MAGCVGSRRSKPRTGAFAPTPKKGANVGFTSGVTALCALALLGRGHDGTGGGAPDRCLVRALEWLLSAQDEDGSIGIHPGFGHSVYNHAFATYALVEAFGLSGDHRWRMPAQRALDFLAMARNPYFVWRYGIRNGENDTSVTSCCILPSFAALQIAATAKSRGLEPPLIVDETAVAGVEAWLGKVTDPDYGSVGYVSRGAGGVGYEGDVPRHEKNYRRANTASMLLFHTQRLSRRKLRSAKLIKLMVARCLQHTPTWVRGKADFYYWYFASSALARYGDKEWKAWKATLNETLLTHQCQAEGDLKGSWEPIGLWSNHAGRLYSTAMAVLALEAPGRTIEDRVNASMVNAALKDKGSPQALCEGIVTWFARQGAKDVGRVLRTASRHKHASVRIAAVESVYVLDKFRAVAHGIVRRRLTDKDSRVRAAAVLAIRTILPNHKKLPEWLAAAAKDESARVRAAAKVDVGLPKEQMAKRLDAAEALSAEDPWARVCALHRVRLSINDAKALAPHAYEALGSDRNSIVRAGLAELGSLLPLEGADFAPVRALLKHADPWIRWQACDTILRAGLDDERARVLPVLTGLMAASDASVASAAIGALDRLGDLSPTWTKGES